MADKGVQINPKIKTVTRDRLKAFCDEQGCSLGDVVEVALEKYLTTDEGDLHALMFQKLNALQEGISVVIDFLGKVLDHLEKQATPPQVPVATYAQMYQERGVQTARVAPAQETPKTPMSTGRWGRLFPRKDAR